MRFSNEKFGQYFKPDPMTDSDFGPDFSIQIMFLFILVLCVSHYVFFWCMNYINKPITKHKFFEYDDRIEYVSNCFHKLNASICGTPPTELDDRVTRFNVHHKGCGGKSGILVGAQLVLEQTDFEALEDWCLHSL